VNNSFWDTQTSGQSSSDGGTGKTTAEMKTQTTYTDAGWDFATVWEMICSNYPTLRSNPDNSLPVDLVSFSAQIDKQSVIISWTTESEVDNLGFILERSDENGVWVQVSSYQTDKELQVRGNTSSVTEYRFIDTNVESGKRYLYRLSDVSVTGEKTVHAPIFVSLKTDASPKTTEMDNAYPNPFNPRTFIAYRLSENTDVNISVFDLLGRSIKILYSGKQTVGSYHVYWNGTMENGVKAPSGNYIIRMGTQNVTQIQKVTLIK
jgi:hypothetical protein